MKNITVYTQSLLFFLLPVVIPFLLWGVWMRPGTYYEVVVSIIFGAITYMMLVMIEIWIIALIIHDTRINE